MRLANSRINKLGVANSRAFSCAAPLIKPLMSNCAVGSSR
ncbi:MAG: hypothetical protein RLZZ574_957, partial [Cyanobacteriota bacterium]